MNFSYMNKTANSKGKKIIEFLEFYNKQCLFIRVQKNVRDGIHLGRTFLYQIESATDLGNGLRKKPFLSESCLQFTSKSLTLIFLLLSAGLYFF